MRISNLAKSMLRYLPVIAVLAATVTGLLIGINLNPTSLDSQPKNPTQLQAETTDRQPLVILGEAGPCGSSNVYTSLPPKCRAADGSFIAAEGTSPYIMRIPEKK